jgi:hypothetical protein
MKAPHQCPDFEVRIILSAATFANFEIEGHWQLIESGVFGSEVRMTNSRLIRWDF